MLKVLTVHASLKLLRELWIACSAARAALWDLALLDQRLGVCSRVKCSIYLEDIVPYIL